MIIRLKYAKKAALVMALIIALGIIPTGAVFAEDAETAETVPEELQAGEENEAAGEALALTAFLAGAGVDDTREAEESFTSGNSQPDQTDTANNFEENGPGQVNDERTEVKAAEVKSAEANSDETEANASKDTVTEAAAAEDAEVKSTAAEGTEIQDIKNQDAEAEGTDAKDTEAPETEASSGRGAESTKILTVSGSGTSRTITIAKTSTAYSSVQAAVWSDTGSQDDLRWYNLTKQSDGSFSISISVGSLRHSGTCYVHAYSGGKFIDGEIFTVAEGELDEFRLKVTGSGVTRTITLPGVYNNSKYRAAVWSKEGGQDDLKWHDMTKQSGGSYAADIQASELKHSGTCYVHVYSGSTFIDGTAFEFTAEEMAALKLKVTGSDGKRVITLPSGYSVKSPKAAVWTAAGGQDDLKWINLTKNSDGSWAVTVSIEDMLHSGTCVVHVYDGSTFVDGNTFTIADGEVKVPHISVSGSDGTRTLTLSDASGLKNVRAAVWSKEGGQDDIKWYNMTKQSGGSWTLEISSGSFRHSGTCYVHVYSGNTFADGTEFQITAEEFKEAQETVFNLSGTGGRRILTVGGPYTALSSLKAAVWSETGGQGDLKWYTAEKQADGTWKIDISVSVLLNSGTVIVHGYSGNTFQFAMTFNLSDAEFEDAVQELTHQYAREILNASGGTLRGAYDWTVRNISYQTLVTPMSVPTSGTYSAFTRQELYLVYAYTNRRGNCFCYAAPVFWCARELGYTARLMEYKYNYGGNPYDTRPHGWVEIDTNGTTYMLDAELQHQYGMNCYMVQSSPLQLRRDLTAY